MSRKSYFDLPDPISEFEHEVFYKHPIYDLYCNQFGIIYEEGEFKQVKTAGKIWIYQGTLRLLTKQIFLIECYLGHTIPKFTQVFFLDGDNENYRIENLSLKENMGRKEVAKYRAARGSFIAETAMDLYDLEVKYEEMGIPPHELHERLMLPLWVTKLSKRASTKKRYKATNTGEKGISQIGKRFVVKIYVGNGYIYGGSFKTLSEAIGIRDKLQEAITNGCAPERYVKKIRNKKDI